VGVHSDDVVLYFGIKIESRLITCLYFMHAVRSTGPRATSALCCARARVLNSISLFFGRTLLFDIANLMIRATFRDVSRFTLEQNL